MKNNTIAIALGSLLLGGVATAGYLNHRDKTSDIQPPSDAAAAQYADAFGEPLPMDSAIPASGRVEYAQVVGVEPVLEREKLYATVIGSEPVRESSTTSNPQQVCEDVVVQERLPERDGNVGGTVAGAVIGGLLGNQVGGGSGKKAATAAGAIAGGVIGNKVDKDKERGQVVTRTERQCHMEDTVSESSKVTGYNVTYRNADGTTGTMRMASKPGNRIAMGNTDRVLGYDVTYLLDGQQGTLRMDSKPQGDRLPVVDGQVVTSTTALEQAPPARQ